jgi:hypothetical protein
MAKQSFSVGQVLTAAQMTSLQQTAMLGGAASAKTTSYTLVAADAGTAISMTSTSATTITVNTALFAAGDTVHITNLGAGVCTITAGTATVNTSASLALAQYESGFLDFTSTSDAIFVKGAGAPATSGGMTLISTTSLTGASVILSSIPQTYNNLELVIQNYKPATDSILLKMRFNGDTGVNYNYEATTSSGGPFTFDYSSVDLGANCSQDNATATGLFQIKIPNYANSTTWKMGYYYGMTNDPTTPTTQYRAVSTTFQYEGTSAISSITLFPAGGNFTSGTALLYGVK